MALVAHGFVRFTNDVDVLITREDGAFKPSPRGFLAACARWELDPADVLYVGDRVDADAAGAAAARMPAVIVTAARLAESRNMLDQTSVDRIVGLIEKAGLPTSGLKLPLDEVMKAMLFDKKVKSGKIRFILPDRIGHVVIRDDIPENLVRDALESLK